MRLNKEKGLPKMGRPSSKGVKKNYYSACNQDFLACKVSVSST